MHSIDFNAIQNLNIPIEQCIDWVEQVFRNKFHAVLPPKISMKFNNGCFFNTMPSLFPDINRFGVKVVSRYPSLPPEYAFVQSGVPPSLRGNILLYDSLNGELLAVMDGTWITAMRTGAVAAITCGLLKKRQTKSYSFIGLGNTARSTLLCLHVLMKNERFMYAKDGLHSSGVSTDPFVYRAPDENEKINQHPWELSREKCILNILKKRDLHNVTDIGTNDMFYTNKLRTFVSGRIYAVDVIFPENETMKNDIICLNNIEKLPDNELDCVVMKDVLEHIENDALFFNNVVNKLK
jgi:hypothetical protein